MASAYKYNRIDLATDAIRLVKLVKGDQSQPIYCEIFETYLHQVEGVPYEALSYVWGTRLSAHQIWLDGCEFGVTENLYEALLHLRRRDEDRVLWVDAICIDQSHNAERGHQVGQMRLVYQAAQKVIIWLGASNKKIDFLYDSMKTLDQQMLFIAQPHTINAWENQWSFVVWKLHEESPPSEIREALSDLLQRDWFSRIWVLQEAALAISAMITCGRKEINSRAFVVMPSLLNIDCTEAEQARLDIMPGLLRAKSWWNGKSGRDLLTLVQKFGRSKASDTRDIIYALLGVSADAHSSGFLRPDYQVSTEEAIQQCIAFFLIQQGNLSKETPPELLPTWSMHEFLNALDDLDLAVFRWATDEAQDALLYDLIVCQRAKQTAERLKEYMHCTSHHGPLITIAIKRGNFDLIKLLLQTPGAKLQTKDPEGKTPIEVAVEYGNGVAAHLIMQHRQFMAPWESSLSDCNTEILAAAKQGAPTLRQLLLLNLEFIDSASHFNGRTLLLTAAKHRDLATVEWILEHAEIDISVVVYTGSESQSVAAAKRHWKEYRDRLAQLFTKGHTASLSTFELKLITGFSVIISLYNFGSYTESKVDRATREDQFRLLRGAVDAEARLEEGGWFGFQTPLGYAAQAGNECFVSILLDQGADINSRDCDELARTPLCHAALRGHLDIVELLVERGADINLATEACDERSAVWCAASNGHADVVKYLLSAGATVGDGIRGTMLLARTLAGGESETEHIRDLYGRKTDA